MKIDQARCGKRFRFNAARGNFLVQCAIKMEQTMVLGFQCRTRQFAGAMGSEHYIIQGMCCFNAARGNLLVQ